MCMYMYLITIKMKSPDTGIHVGYVAIANQMLQNLRGKMHPLQDLHGTYCNTDSDSRITHPGDTQRVTTNEARKWNSEVLSLAGRTIAGAAEICAKPAYID